MMPLPGFQNPMPYFADTERRNSYTSLLMSRANLQVDVGAGLGLDEVVAVHRARHGHLGQAGGHELQQRHLRGGVLHGHAVGVEVGVAAAALELLALGVGEVVDEHLLGERERPAEAAAPEGGAVGQGRVDALHQLDRRACGDGHVRAPSARLGCERTVLADSIQVVDKLQRLSERCGSASSAVAGSG